ncbi:MAG: hypothetical protein M3P48_02220 [Actinomycetota bacterium]|nr:hypothetical protein [Actinomycetota bacterium]
MSNSHGVGRVVRWDADDGTGSVVVDGLPAEIVADADAVEVPGDRGLHPGELVEVEFEQTVGGGYRAVRVCPTDAEP